MMPEILLGRSADRRLEPGRERGGEAADDLLRIAVALDLDRLQTDGVAARGRAQRRTQKEGGTGAERKHGGSAVRRRESAEEGDEDAGTARVLVGHQCDDAPLAQRAQPLLRRAAA